MADQEISLAEQFKEALENFSSLSSITLTDVQTLAETFAQILEEVDSASLDSVSMTEAINVMLDTFSEEGLSSEDYEKFYQDLSDDVTDDELVSDIQHLIYAYLTDISRPAFEDGAIVTSSTLTFTPVIAIEFITVLFGFFANGDSGLSDTSAQQAMSLILAKITEAVNGLSQSSVETLWESILQVFQDNSEDESTVESVDGHFEAILKMYRNINFSSFASGLYDWIIILSFVQAYYPSLIELHELMQYYLEENLETEGDTRISGQNLVTAITAFSNDEKVKNLTSEDDLEKLYSFLVTSYFSFFENFKASSLDSMVFPATLVSSHTSEIGLYAVKFDEEVVAALVSSFLVALETVLAQKPEDLVYVQTLTTEILSNGKATLNEISSFASEIYDYLILNDYDEDLCNLVYMNINSIISVLQTDGLANLLAVTVNESYLASWSTVLQAQVTSVLIQKTDLSYNPYNTIGTIVSNAQALMLTQNNIADDGVSLANFIAMQIEILDYLSLFMEKEELDALASMMNAMASTFFDESEQEDEEEAALEMWIQIGIAIALLVVTVVITVFTFGVGTGAAAAVDAAVIGGEVATDVVVDAAVEGAIDGAVEGGIELTEISAEAGVEGSVEAESEIESEIIAEAEESVEQGAEDSGEIGEQGDLSDIEEEEEDLQGEESEDEQSEESEDEGEDEEGDEDEDEQGEEDDDEECFNNFQTLIETAANKGDLIVILATIIELSQDLADLDVAGTINDVTSIISSVSNSFQALCTSNSDETDTKKVFLAIAWALNNEVTTLIDAINSQIPDPTDGNKITTIVFEFLSNAYSIATGLLSLISGILVIVQAQGGDVSINLTSSLKANSGNAITLKNNIEDLADYIDDS